MRDGRELRFARLAAWLVIGLVSGTGVFGLVGGVARASPSTTLRPAAQATHAGPTFGTTSVSFTNWAGYAVAGSNGSVTDVKGSWTVPSFKGTCGGLYNFSEAAFWVGIDGYSSSTVEQIGTSIECTSLLYLSSVTYFAWYEFYPALPVTIGKKVSHGDHISAEAKYSSSGSYILSIKDTSTGKSFTKSTSSVSASRSSAEWVTEAPSGVNGILPLVDFGTVPFYGCSATISSHTSVIGGFSNVKMTMVDIAGTANKAVPSGLSPSGGGFSVAWKSYGP